jgi:HSP20 family protein
MTRLDKSKHERPFRVSRVEDLFDRWLSDRFDWALRGFVPVQDADWTPPVDVIAREDRIVLKIELPGVKRENLELSVTEDSVTLKGETKAESAEQEESTYVRERVTGRFSRRIRLPDTVDPQNATAVLQDGVLELTLPKQGPPESREFRVKID